jgi:hypothetical protein
MFIDSFKQHFESVADPRQSAKVTYPFFDILFGSLCAVIAGARGWFDIREYLLGHHKWFLAYSHAWRSLNNIHADHVITSMPITQ